MAWCDSIKQDRKQCVAANFTRFIPRFDTSLPLRYEAEKYGALRAAVEEWNNTLNILGQQRIADEDWVFSRLAVVIHNLEVNGDVQLGDYMTQLCNLGRQHAQMSKAKINSRQGDQS